MFADYKTYCWYKHLGDFFTNEDKREKYWIELFVEEDERFDALVFGTISRDYVLKQLEDIRGFYDVGKEERDEQRTKK